MMSPADREEGARQVLPPDVYAYYAAGSGQGQTFASQETAWAEVLLRPRLLRDTSRVETKTTVLGTPVAGPVLVAPTAGHGMAHTDGEAASARGAAAAGSLMVLSMRGSSRVEAVAAAGPYWQQIYVLSDRGVSDEVAVRAAAAGARAIVLTVDTPFVTAKAVGGYPAGMPLQGVIEALDRREAGETGLLQVPVRPDDISRLAELTGLPVVVKGVLRADEAQRCLDNGASAIVVSTHGGRQLDGVVPAPRALVEVVDAVGETEVYVDGGVRTGIDVLRALGLGARAVLLGRPVLWALATGGPDGVQHLLEDVVRETAEALTLAGATSPADVGRDLVTWR